jgi:hypothetical protein
MFDGESQPVDGLAKQRGLDQRRRRTTADDDLSSTAIGPI